MATNVICPQFYCHLFLDVGFSEAFGTVWIVSEIFNGP